MWLAFYHLHDIPNKNTKFDNRQTDGNGRPSSSYCRRHERSRKRKNRELVDVLDYNTSLSYAREVKMHGVCFGIRGGREGNEMVFCFYKWSSFKENSANLQTLTVWTDSCA